VKILVTVILENLDHPGDNKPSHYEECDACRQRLHEAIEDAIVGYSNRYGALPGVEALVFTGEINKYELIGNNIHLRKRASWGNWGTSHTKDDVMPRDWITSEER
jgi:hypothetical protein